MVAAPKPTHVVVEGREMVLLAPEDYARLSGLSLRSPTSVV